MSNPLLERHGWTTRYITADYQIIGWGQAISASCSTADITATLYYVNSASKQNNGEVIVVKTDNTAFKVLVVPSAGNTLNGGTTAIELLKQGDCVKFWNDDSGNITAIVYNLHFDNGQFLQYDNSTPTGIKGALPPTQFDATVGAGGNYPTWSAAYAAGKRSLVTVGNATETANIVFDNTLSITINPGVTYNLGNFNFQCNADGSRLDVDARGLIVWSPTSSKAFVNGSGFQDTTFFRASFNLDGTGSTSSNCSLYQGINSVVSEGITRINLPNLSNWGFNLSGNGLCFEAGLIALLNINPTGPNINNIISGSAGVPTDIKEVVLVGTFDNVNPVINTTGTAYEKIKFLDISGGQTLKFNIGGKLNGVSLPFGGAVDIGIAGDGTQITNCDIGTGDIDINTHVNVKLINVKCDDVIGINSSTVLDVVSRAVDSNPFIRNIDIYNGIETIVTSAGTTTLTNASPEIIVFTGTTTHTLVLDDATELLESKQYQIQNESTGIVTINKNGGGLLTTVNGGTDILITLKDNATAAGVWHVSAVSGGGGTPGGTNGQIQYNNSGSFGGASITTTGAGDLTATNWELSNSGALELDNYLNLAQLTTIQRNAITANAGMVVYNTDTSVLEYYGGSPLGWQPFPSGVLALQGNWDASTNTPTLTAGIGTNGFAYYVAVAGTQTLPSGVSTVYNVGDLVYYTTSSAIWNKLSGGSIVTIYGRTGPAITAQTGDYTVAQVTDALSNVLPTNNFFAGNGSNVAVANTPTQATALLNAMVGDSGSGGTKGLVPAPAANDSVKFLKGDGTFGNTYSIATIVTAAGTTTLTFTSANIQRFTGSTTQILVLPNATTLSDGKQYLIQNESSGAITVNMNGGTLLTTVAAATDILITLYSNGTSAGSWHVSPSGGGGVSFPITIAQGGTNTTTQPFSTGAVYYDGTKLTTAASNAFINYNGAGQTGVGGAPNASYIFQVSGKANVTGIFSSLAHARLLTSTVTSGSSTAIAANSPAIQRFTGTSTQIVFLPNATGIPIGLQYEIQNESTSAITINRNDASLLYTLPANSNTTVTLANNGTAAGTWNYNPVATAPLTDYVGDYKMSAKTLNHGVWFRCDGTAISRTTYAALFALIGISFGAGDGSTTFNIPDFRGRVYGTVGSGSGLTPRTMGTNVGVESVTLSSGQIPGHTHAFSNRYQGIGTGGSGSNALVTSTSAFDGTATVTPASFGGGGSHDNMQPTLFGGEIYICHTGL